MTDKDLARRYPDAPTLVADLEDALAIEAARAGHSTGEATAVLRTLPEPRPAPPAVPDAPLVPSSRVVAGARPSRPARRFLLKEGVDRTQRGTGTGHGQARAAGPRVVSLKRTSADDYDPLGGDGEHPEQAPLAVDKDPGTAWSTERYSDQALTKEGVGHLRGRGARRRRAVARDRQPLDGLAGHDLRRPRAGRPSRCPTLAGAASAAASCAARTSASGSPRAASAIATSSCGSPSCRRDADRVEISEVALFQRKPA